MRDDKIHIPAKHLKPVTERQVIRISAEAYNALVDLYNESSLTMCALVSKIVLESVDRVVLDKEED